VNERQSLEAKIRFALQRHENRLWAMTEVLEERAKQAAAELAGSQAGPAEHGRFLTALKAGKLEVQAFPLFHFHEDGAFATRLQFGLRPGTDPVDGKCMHLAKSFGYLEELALACVRRGLEFGRSFPGSQLHLDLEVEALSLEFSVKILALASTPEERARICLFLPAHFGEAVRKRVFKGAMALKQGGIEIGIREVGGGGTVMENIMLLGPSWIRFSPLLFQGLADFKIKRDYLRHW